MSLIHSSDSVVQSFSDLLSCFSCCNTIHGSFFLFSALQGKAKGRRSALWTRSIVQKQLFDLGCFLHHHAGKVLFISVLILATCCVGLKSACVQSRVDQLWIEGEFLWNSHFILFGAFQMYLIGFLCIIPLKGKVDSL